MKMTDRITIDPAICRGKPCIRGLRYPVETVLEWLAGGMSLEEILADYQDLEHGDILAVQAVEDEGPCVPTANVMVGQI